MTLAAGILRFYRLGEQSIWNDEWFSIDVASSTLAAIQPKLIAFYHHPPFFLYLLHGVFIFLGEQLWALRFLSALSGALTVGIVYYFTSRMFNNIAGIFAAALCSLSPFHLVYSQEGRPYALAGLLCLISCCSMMMYLRDRKRLLLVSYFLSTIALLYTHHWGIFVLASQIAVILFFSKTSFEMKKTFGVIWLITAICYIPEMAALLQQSSARGTSTGLWWAEQPNLSELLYTTEAFSGTYFKMASSVFDSLWVIKIIGAGSVVLLTVLGLYNLMKKDSAVVLKGMFYCVLLTLLLPFLLSFYKQEIFLWYRYTVIVFPALCVCFGGLCATSKWKGIASACVIILIMLGAAGTFRYFSWSKSNVRDVARYTEEATADSVKLLIRPAYFAPLLNYYYKGSAHQLDETYLDKPLGEIVDTAATFAYISLDTPSEIRDYMDRHFDKVSEKIFPGEAHMGIIVGVYKQKPDEDDEEKNNN